MSPPSFAIVDRPRFDVACPRCGSAAGVECWEGQTRENCSAHNAMQRRCAEPRRQHRFRCFSPWRGSSTGRECGSGADQTARTAARVLIA